MENTDRMDKQRAQPVFDDGLEVATLNYESGLEVVVHDKKFLDIPSPTSSPAPSHASSRWVPPPPSTAHELPSGVIPPAYIQKQAEINPFVSHQHNQLYQHLLQQQQPSYTATPPGSSGSPWPASNAPSIAPPEAYFDPEPQYPRRQYDLKAWRQSEQLLCGLRRQTFLMIFAGVVVLAVIAIGVGLGVGLSQSHSDTVTETNGVEIVCPEADEQVFHASGTQRFFRVICGVDYSSADGAEDLASIETDSVADCIDACADRDDCVASGWGVVNNVQTCFLKSALGEPNDSSRWIFTKEVDDPGKDVKA